MPNPPKCRICGKVEWRHLCSGQASVKIKPSRQRKAYAREYYDKVRRKKDGRKKRDVVENGKPSNTTS